jgi:hypothetical protein
MGNVFFPSVNTILFLFFCVYLNLICLQLKGKTVVDLSCECIQVASWLCSYARNTIPKWNLTFDVCDNTCWCSGARRESLK